MQEHHSREQAINLGRILREDNEVHARKPSLCALNELTDLVDVLHNLIVHDWSLEFGHI